MNRLAQSLAEFSRQNLLAEKWLAAPSLRIARQWLDAVTRSGQSLVNVRPTTLRALALEQAAATITSSGSLFLPVRAGEMLVERILATRRRLGLAYLGKLEPSAGLSQAVYRAIQSLRLAGLTPDDLPAGSFEVPEKGRDLRDILRAYLTALSAEGWVDYAGVLEAAIGQLVGGTAPFPRDAWLLAPAGLAEHDLERRFLRAFGGERVRTLELDEPRFDAALTSPQSSPAATDLEALRWILAPGNAPAPRQDGTARIERAVGEVNEVRGVLRTCHARGIRWDDVELLHTDSNVYVPLIYEALSALALREGEAIESGADLPVTFAEGVPVRYSRPGRALALWIAWIRDDFPQDTLLKMLREGLLEIPAEGTLPGFEPSLSRLAKLLRRVGIGFGRARYATQIAERLAQLEYARSNPDVNDDDAMEKSEEDRAARLGRQIAELKVLDRLCQRLLAQSPARQAPPAVLLAAARTFLLRSVRRGNKLDNFALWGLIDPIDEMARWLPRDPAGISIDLWKWLETLPVETRVLGNGPRPGSLHVAPLLAGGHSGRRHTFVIGLDDARFPGGGLEDPLLLDHERARLSPELATGAKAMEQRTREFGRLLARLQGEVVLSYAMQSVAADREMFPSPLLVSAYRVLSGERTGEPSALRRWLEAQGPAVSFAPRSDAEALSEADWWTHRLLGESPVAEPRALVESRHPQLAAGRQAVESRLSDRLTEFDGLSPAAGFDLDPAREISPGVGASAMSAHRLTTIGRCPLAFFFQHGLNLELPEPISLDPDVWLDNAAHGLLLHELFEAFLRELVEADRTPDFARDHARLETLLTELIEKYRQRIPPPRKSAFQKQCELLRETAVTFLREEEIYCRQSGARPIYLEASLGLPRTDEHHTPLDVEDPMPLALPDGRHVWVRGRIDRIDETTAASLVGAGGARTFAIWDYKTGGTSQYSAGDPFRQGRMLQPYLYVTLVEHRLRQAHGPQAQVAQFGFFFPAPRAAGQRIAWTPGQLKDGGRIVDLLVRTVAGGTFLATTNPDDCKFCDFQRICGDIDALTAASRRKIAAGHPALAPLVELRPQ